MRLRSSQLVFLLFLACSLQVRQESALRWIAGPIAGPASVRSIATVATTAPLKSRAQAATASPDLALAPAAIALVSATRPMPHPAAATAAIASHTSLIRA